MITPTRPRPPIIRLLLRICPTAVFGFVVAVVVRIAVDRRFTFRTRSHVGEKVIERMNPPITYFNPAPSVDRKLVIGRIITPRLHGFPSIMFFSSRSSMMPHRKRMLFSPFIGERTRSDLALKTTATFCPSVFEVLEANRLDRTAVTSAFAIMLTVFSKVRQDSHSSHFLTRNIGSSLWHGCSQPMNKSFVNDRLQ